MRFYIVSLLCKWWYVVAGEPGRTSPFNVLTKWRRGDYL